MADGAQSHGSNPDPNAQPAQHDRVLDLDIDRAGTNAGGTLDARSWKMCPDLVRPRLLVYL